MARPKGSTNKKDENQNPDQKDEKNNNSDPKDEKKSDNETPKNANELKEKLGKIKAGSIIVLVSGLVADGLIYSENEIVENPGKNLVKCAEKNPNLAKFIKKIDVV